MHSATWLWNFRDCEENLDHAPCWAGVYCPASGRPVCSRTPDVGTVRQVDGMPVLDAQPVRGYSDATHSWKIGAYIALESGIAHRHGVVRPFHGTVIFETHSSVNRLID